MRVFIAGLSDSRQYVKSHGSFYGIKRRDGDAHWIMAETIGYAARSIVARRFERVPEYDAIMLCDLDMAFPPDTLERLRSHDKDMVTAHYYKRKTRPMQSTWGTSLTGNWPYIPMIDVPRQGIHRLATAGFGAVLIKRHVFEAVTKLIGQGGATAFDTGPLPETGHQGTFGADMRFFWYAQHLGFELWGDASIDIPHGKEMWITHKLYDKLNHRVANAESVGDHFTLMLEYTGMDKNAFEMREQQLRLEIQKAEGERDTWDKKVAVLSGQLAELLTWKDEVLAGPRPAQQIGRVPEKLPTFADTGEDVNEAIKNRHLASDGSDKEEALKKDEASSEDTA